MINKLKALLVVATNWSDPSETIHAQNELLDSLPELLTRLEKLEAAVSAASLYIANYDSGRGYNEWNEAISLLGSDAINGNDRLRKLDAVAAFVAKLAEKEEDGNSPNYDHLDDAIADAQEALDALNKRIGEM